MSRAASKRQVLAFADHIEEMARNDMWSYCKGDRLFFNMKGTNFNVSCPAAYDRAVQLANKIRKGAKSISFLYSVKICPKVAKQKSIRKQRQVVQMF